MSFWGLASSLIPRLGFARLSRRVCWERSQQNAKRGGAYASVLRPRLARRCSAGASLCALLFFLTIIATASANSPWITLQGGRYLAKRPNDGDSFHVSVDGKEYIFRLYFIDAPETSKEFRDRVEEQARNYDITSDQVLQVGELAKRFVREKLNEPFLIRTCWEDAGGRSRMQRFYAFVQTKTGDLAEQLVENGLARSHATTTRPDGLSAAAAESQKLTRLERKAMKQKVGGWGVGEGNIAQRASDPESEKGIDPFDRFFRPEGDVQVLTTAVPSPARVAPTRTPSWLAAAQGARTPPAPPPARSEVTPADTWVSKVPPRLAQVATAPPSAASPSASTDFVEAPAEGPMVEVKLNINTSSEAELESISGIGPVLAHRIMAARPFNTADDLRYIKGIGHITYGKIRPYFE